MRQLPWKADLNRDHSGVMVLMGTLTACTTRIRRRGGSAAAGLIAAALVFGSGTPAVAGTPHARSAAGVAGSLAGVSCATKSMCMAVGGRAGTSAGPGGALAERWNGTKWSAVKTPNPGSSGATLAGVDCTSAKACIAVGHYFKTSSHSTLPAAEKWNGTKWTVVKAPAPSGATDAYLEAVSCATAKDCWASGVNGVDTLTERWNGSKWSIAPSVSPIAGKPNVLSGMACPAASECWAVGYDFATNFTGSLTERWNGTKWAVVSTPNSTSGELIGDACHGSSDCLAVGIGNNLFAIGQHWNGTKWTTAAPAKPSGAKGSDLTGVGCASAAACEAVGNYSTSGGTLALAERWNGSKWAAQKTPAISGGSFVSLAGVSCPAASDCWAAGESITKSSGKTSPLLEHWNGTSWKSG